MEVIGCCGVGAEPTAVVGGATGDIFGDLMNALNRRRKGIAMKQGAAGCELVWC